MDERNRFAGRTPCGVGCYWRLRGCDEGVRRLCFYVMNIIVSEGGMSPLLINEGKFGL